MKISKLILLLSINIFISSCNNQNNVLPTKIDNPIKDDNKQQNTSPKNISDNDDTKIDKEFFISDPKNNLQTNTDISVNKDGNTIVSWTSHSSNTKVEIYARIYDKEYKPLTSPFKVNENEIATELGTLSIKTSKYKSYTNSDSDGNFTISWVNEGKLCIKVYSSNGKQIKNEFTPKINVDDEIFDLSSDQSSPKPIVSLKNGNSFVIYENRSQVDYSNANDFISTNCVFFDKNFNQIGKTIKLKIFSGRTFIGSYDEDKILILFLDNNNFLKVLRFDSKGNKIGEEFTVLDNNVLSINFDIHINNDGSFFVSYYKNPIMQNDLYLRKYGVDNKEVNQEKKINTIDLNSNSLNPIMSFSPYINVSDFQNNSFAFVWGEELLERPIGNIYLRRFDDKFEPKEKEIQVNYFYKGFNATPNVSINNDKNILVTWSNWNDNKNTFQIFGRKYNLDNPFPTDDKSLIPEEKVNCNLQIKNNKEESWDKNMIIKVKIEDKTLIIDSKEKYLDLLEKNKDIKNLENVKTITVNGNSVDSFPSIVFRLKNSFCLDELNKKYKFSSSRSNFGFNYVSSKMAGDNIQSLLKNKFRNINIKEVEFSSISALFDYYLFLELSINHKDLFEDLYLEGFFVVG